MTEQFSPSATPQVSWLLCSHVVDDQLRLALQSCLSQTFKDFELIVVANGAAAADVAAAVREWVGGDPRVRVFTTEIRHLIFSLSLGLHHARGILVARMDGDDISKVNRLERQVAYMNAHPEVAVLGTAYEIIDADGSTQGLVTLPVSDTAIRKAMLKGNPLCHPSVMFRRKAVLDVGGYLGALHAEDYDLWLRMAANPGNKFANLEEACLSYRSVGVGAARRSRSAYATMAAAQYRNFLNGQGWVWVVAVLMTTVKAFVRSNAGRPGSY